ncbi:cysteine desulfurase family protein [Sphingomonas sp. BK069]|uniref:cysteine desulfurase family protein n=1 Tax=Sphingomonas sp. BK069 TaxID=2586979 RepID=UPI001617C5AE|nr:cysteine desulfurase family protein [Sphingomonas sp. BK069]MBB3346250.1 cysteine desulfurase [Sphingomonas sp. BK069]
MTYLDYQATTPLAPEALEAMLPWLRDQHANPHSPHRPGRAARAAVELARDRVAALLPPGGRVAFTSGATEALNWAIKGAPPRRVVTIATEHAAVLDSVAARGDAIVLPVGTDGLVDLAAAERAIVPGVALVAAMLVNNEVGVIQPLDALAAMAKRAGALLLCDAVQGFGRVAIPAGADLVAVSAHKVYGPKGIGALWIRDGVTLAPLLHGGDQESGRSGTLSPALCAGFGAAALLLAERREVDAGHIERLWQVARERLPGWTINGATEARYRGNLSVRRGAVDVARLMSDVRDVAFSAGSACASGSGRSSHVLRALGLSEAEARSTIRLGFGRYTREDELAAALDRLDAAARAQRIAA